MGNWFLTMSLYQGVFWLYCLNSLLIRGSYYNANIICKEHNFSIIIRYFGYIIKINMIYLLTAIGLSHGGSSTVHIYTQIIHRTTQNKQYLEQHNNLGKCGPCPVLASYTLAFFLQLRKKHGKPSVSVAESRNT